MFFGFFFLNIIIYNAAIVKFSFLVLLSYLLWLLVSLLTFLRLFFFALIFRRALGLGNSLRLLVIFLGFLTIVCHHLLYLLLDQASLVKLLILLLLCSCEGLLEYLSGQFRVFIFLSLLRFHKMPLLRVIHWENVSILVSFSLILKILESQCFELITNAFI